MKSNIFYRGLERKNKEGKEEERYVKWFSSDKIYKQILFYWDFFYWLDFRNILNSLLISLTFASDNSWNF